jgi:hypothetical protein
LKNYSVDINDRDFLKVNNLFELSQKHWWKQLDRIFFLGLQVGKIGLAIVDSN